MSRPSEDTLISLIRDLQDSSITPPLPGKYMPLIPDSETTWPVWILWLQIFDRDLTERQRYELSCYRYVFGLFVRHLHLAEAARVLIAARTPLTCGYNINELLLSSDVIRGCLAEM